MTNGKTKKRNMFAGETAETNEVKTIKKNILSSKGPSFKINDMNIESNITVQFYSKVTSII
jgi:hypothetical protein